MEGEGEGFLSCCENVRKCRQLSSICSGGHLSLLYCTSTSASGRTCVSDFILFRERIKLVIVLFQGEISVASYIFLSIALSLFTDKIKEHIYLKLIN